MSDIEDLINAAIEKDYSLANDKFDEIMGEKMADALEQEKISVASSIYGEELDHEEDEDLEDEELNDEDLEDEELNDEDLDED